MQVCMGVCGNGCKWNVLACTSMASLQGAASFSDLWDGWCVVVMEVEMCVAAGAGATTTMVPLVGCAVMA